MAMGRSPLRRTERSVLVSIPFPEDPAVILLSRSRRGSSLRRTSRAETAQVLDLRAHAVPAAVEQLDTALVQATMGQAGSHRSGSWRSISRICIQEKEGLMNRLIVLFASAPLASVIAVVKRRLLRNCRARRRRQSGCQPRSLRA